MYRKENFFGPDTSSSVTQEELDLAREFARNGIASCLRDFKRTGWQNYLGLAEGWEKIFQTLEEAAGAGIEVDKIKWWAWHQSRSKILS